MYRLITRGTLEEKIMGLQKFKLSIASSIVNAGPRGVVAGALAAAPLNKGVLKPAYLPSGLGINHAPQFPFPSKPSFPSHPHAARSSFAPGVCPSPL